jgi:hypothetical protein
MFYLPLTKRHISVQPRREQHAPCEKKKSKEKEEPDHTLSLVSGINFLIALAPSSSFSSPSTCARAEEEDSTRGMRVPSCLANEI